MAQPAGSPGTVGGIGGAAAREPPPGFADLDVQTIRDQKNKAAAYLEQQCSAALEIAKQQHESQKTMIKMEGERTAAVQTQQIQAKRDQEIMILEQSHQQQKMAIEQAFQSKLMEIEQAALAMTAQAQQQSLQREIYDRLSKMHPTGGAPGGAALPAGGMMGPR
jgi:hypothetical protein